MRAALIAVALCVVAAPARAQDERSSDEPLVALLDRARGDGHGAFKSTTPDEGYRAIARKGDKDETTPKPAYKEDILGWNPGTDTPKDKWADLKLQPSSVEKLLRENLSDRANQKMEQDADGKPLMVPKVDAKTVSDLLDKGKVTR